MFDTRAWRARTVVGGDGIEPPVIERVETGEFQFRFEETSNALSRHSAELLRRTLQLGRILGWDTPSMKSPSSDSTVSMLPSIIAAGPAF
jgi:hypothetical protein